MISQIKKRDGRIVEFGQDKIAEAIFKAAASVGGRNKKLSKDLAGKVVELLEKKLQNENREIPDVEEVQDIVEKVLIEDGRAQTAKAYILWRQKRKEIRDAKSMLGVVDELKLPMNSIRVLAKRYLRKDENGKILESTGELFRRVADNIAQADLIYDKNADVKKTEEEFYGMMTKMEFLPNSPTLMNAGRELQQLSACFVIPVGDSIEEIFDAVKYTAIVQKSGGGTGFSFSRLRPKGDFVKTTSGVASGPISFMKIFDVTCEQIKQGMMRMGANMGILRVDHPDVLEFITCKESGLGFSNFNISIALTDKFMDALRKNEDYDLITPRSKKVAGKMPARKVFDLIVMMAWKNGDPGIIFIDRINHSASNPTPNLGEIESTNPCGEQPLLPFESCNLGSINLVKMLKPSDKGYEIDWDKLKDIVRKSVHFMDNVIDMNRFAIPQIKKMTTENRKIGLGAMGFADMLIMLEIPYNSEEAERIAEKVMKFIDEESKNASSELAEKRGAFPNFEGSIHDKPGARLLRNATTTTIAPTGTLSIIAGCSSGVEPLFAVAFTRNVMGGAELVEVNPLFETALIKEALHSDDIMKKVALSGTVQHINELPKDIRKMFVCAHDITPEWHVRIQAAFQKYTDNAVSKTINFPHNASPKDVEDAYMLAYKLGCKGVTIYRDKSREAQVLDLGAKSNGSGRSGNGM